MSAGRIKISQMPDAAALSSANLLHLVQGGSNTKLEIDRLFDYLSANNYPRVHITEGVPENDLGNPGDICYADHPYPNAPGPWVFGPKADVPDTPWGNGWALIQGPQGDGIVDDVFWVGRNEVKKDFTMPDNSNAMSAGPIKVSAEVDTGDGQWTVIGEEDTDPHALRDLIDVEAGETVFDQEALLWQADDGVWKPGPAPTGPRGFQGEDGSPGQGFQYQETVSVHGEIDGWPNSYTGEIGDGFYVELDRQMWVWSAAGEFQSIGEVKGDQGSQGDKGDSGINGTDGKGWFKGEYHEPSGVVTFKSNDGLDFDTGDLRGTDGIDAKGWTSGVYNEGDGKVTFSSDDGLGFATTDLRGTDGISPPELPHGIISMWASNDIRDFGMLGESGWWMCDGGTHAAGHPLVDMVPDLRNMFVLGTEQGLQGAGTTTGTTGDHTLTSSQMPSHSHSGSSNRQGGHNHNVGPMINATSASIPTTSGNLIVARGTSFPYRDTTTAGDHSHSITINSAGSNAPHSHTIDEASLPHYRLAYIIYLGTKASHLG